MNRRSILRLIPLSFASFYAQRLRLRLHGPSETPPPTTGALTFYDKVSQSGVFNSRSFYNTSGFNYSWTSGDAFEGDSDSRLSGKTNYQVTNARATNIWNTVCADGLGQIFIPEIDTDPLSLGTQTPALRFTIGPYTDARCGGYFAEVLKRYSDNTFGYVGPVSSMPDATAHHLGNVLYVQYKILFSSGYISTDFDQCANGASQIVGLATSGAGSTTLTSPSYDQFNSSHVGLKIIIYAQNDNNLGNWVQGIYTITGFNNSRSVTLDISPTPSGAGTGNAYGSIGAGTNGNPPQSGFKQNIFYGNPNGQSHDCSVVVQDQAYRGLWQSYNHRPSDAVQNHQISLGGLGDIDLQPGMGCSYLNQPSHTNCLEMTPNIWNEVKVRIELGTPGTEDSIFDLWVNGTHVVHFPTMELGFQDAASNGLGQWDIGPYWTIKSPTQNHATAYCFYKDFIFSTSDITDGSLAVNALEIAAANLQPGTWTEFSTTGFDDTLLNPTSGGQSGLDFQHKFVWDSDRHIAKLWLGEHTSCNDGSQMCADADYRAIEYHASTNTWVELFDANTGYSNMGWGYFFHTYSQATLDPSTGDWYVKVSLGSIYKWTQATQTWSAMTNPSSGILRVDGNYSIGLAWFPGVGLIACSGNTGAGNQVALWNGTSWSSISHIWNFGNNDNIAIYNPILDAMLIGGGQAGVTGEDQLHRIDRDLTVTDLGTAPFAIEGSSVSSNVTFDPITGIFLTLHRVSGTNRLYTYDMDTDTWTLLGSGYNPPTDIPMGLDNDMTAGTISTTAISSYGVIMVVGWINSGAGQQKVWLYKHSN